MREARPRGPLGQEPPAYRRRLVAAVDMEAPPRVALEDADGVHMVVTLHGDAIGVASVLRPDEPTDALEPDEIRRVLNARLGYAAWNALLVGRVHDRLGRWWEHV